MQRPTDGSWRTCVGCMEPDRKEHMLRIVARNNGLTLDEEARMAGRGAYIHDRNRCIKEFVNSKAKELRSLKRKISRDERRELGDLIRARLDSGAAIE